MIEGVGIKNTTSCNQQQPAKPAATNNARMRHHCPGRKKDQWRKMFLNETYDLFDNIGINATTVEQDHVPIKWVLMCEFTWFALGIHTLRAAAAVVDACERRVAGRVRRGGGFSSFPRRHLVSVTVKLCSPLDWQPDASDVLRRPQTSESPPRGERAGAREARPKS